MRTAEDDQAEESDYFSSRDMQLLVKQGVRQALDEHERNSKRTRSSSKPSVEGMQRWSVVQIEFNYAVLEKITGIEQALDSLLMNHTDLSKDRDLFTAFKTIEKA